MITVNYRETNIPMSCASNLVATNGFDIGASLFEPITKTFIQGMTDAIISYKDTNKSASLILEDLSGQFLIGIKIAYNNNDDDPTNAGNWKISASFYKEDMEADTVLKFFDPQITALISSFAFANNSMTFDNSAAMNIIAIECFKNISQWLEENAKVDDRVQLVLEYGFTAECQIKNNIVEKSISLDGACTKTLLKKAGADEMSSIASGMEV